MKISIKSILFSAFIFLLLGNFFPSPLIAYSLGKNTHKTENIYSTIERNRYPNIDNEKRTKLFTFYSSDADCPETSKKCSSIDCSAVNSEKCKQLQEKCRMEQCKDSIKYGKSGTIEMAKNLIIGGSKIFLLGFNKLGFHWFKTGLEGFSKNVIGFKENSKDIYFANNTTIENNIFLNNNESKIIWGNSNIEKTTSGINFNSNNNTIANIQNTEYQVHINNGLEINGNLKTNALKWKGDTDTHQQLYWSPILGMSTGYPSPSNENKSILFYCDQVSGSGSCPN